MEPIRDQNPQTSRPTQTEKIQPPVILVGVDLGAYDMDTSMRELEELACAAGLEVVGTITQKREHLDRATAIGSGRVEEVKAAIQALSAGLVIFDVELTGSQIHNLEKALDADVIDRTMLILEIFSRRAITSEGRLQVELARSQYMLPRLTGKGDILSRQGGGGGGGAGARRGGGESQLEVDRRHLKRRIKQLEKKLDELEIRRSLINRRRKKDGIRSVAIVGYTNVGKSTLLNHLTHAGALVQDMLFATLDPTARALKLPDGRSVMLIDTVGLVRRLPHGLIKAFASTLEQAAQADLILNVCDASAEEADEQIQVASELLSEIGAGDLPVITVLNKCDKLTQPLDGMGRRIVPISAKTGQGMDRLLLSIQELLPSPVRRLTLLIPYEEGSLPGWIERTGKILSREYLPEGLKLETLMEGRYLDRLGPYLQLGE